MTPKVHGLIGALVLVLLANCAPSAGTVVLAWGSEEPTHTTYEVSVDRKVVAKVVTQGVAKAEVHDERGNVRRTHAPLEIDLSAGPHEINIVRNGKPHWSKVITVTDRETEFYYSLPEPEGESPQGKITATTTGG